MPSWHRDNWSYPSTLSFNFSCLVHPLTIHNQNIKEHLFGSSPFNTWLKANLMNHENLFLNISWSTIFTFTCWTLWKNCNKRKKKFSSTSFLAWYIEHGNWIYQSDCPIFSHQNIPNKSLHQLASTPKDLSLNLILMGLLILLHKEEVHVEFFVTTMVIG